MTDTTLLLVDDDEVLRHHLARAITVRGFRVLSAGSCAQALAILDQTQPDMAVLDLNMPDGSGLELLQTLRERVPRIRAIVLTGYGSIANAVEAMRLGAINYVTKPADADQVLEAFDLTQPSAANPNYQPPSLAEAEWNHIQQVLADCDGNITQTAKLLGIPRRTLQRKLKKLAP